MAEIYRCRGCLAASDERFERCANCGSWATCELADGGEQTSAPAPINTKPAKAQRLADIGPGKNAKRIPTGIKALDHFLDGGLVPGQILTLSGDPGAGKSTLCLQLLRGLLASPEVSSALYASSEEMPIAIADRARRLGEIPEDLHVLASNDLAEVLGAAAAVLPRVIVLDSIQRVSSEDVSGRPGSVLQVNGCAEIFTRYCQAAEVVGIIIVQVLKDGDMAGPKALEHLVDTTLHLELNEIDELRRLRAGKNRFAASVGSIAMRMLEDGLAVVE